MSETPQRIKTFRLPSLPQSLPFCSAARIGDTVYVSGQIGHVPGELRLVAGGLEPEARQALNHLSAALEVAGSALDRVVKCMVYSPISVISAASTRSTGPISASISRRAAASR